ncbi:alpha/beta fold hydrolase [Pseudonocardia adelaidensis]|uniref:alpha/beta fold hydrolase n=1 Tax=Pseudonocardia adelaidensis TaxID=648754 RepID=UPI0031EE9532
MTTFVLVHGAWHGGWCWRDVVAPLRSAGHDVVVPTLLGLGERAGEFRPDIGLRDHVDDVVGALEGADLRDVVLVGHSYAGLVVREAADRVPERVAQLVLVDAWAGPDGASIDSLAPEYFRSWVDSVSDGGATPVPAARTAGVTDPQQVAWVEALMTPQPRRTFSDPTRLTGAVDAVPCRAVICTPPGRIPFGAWARGFGWPTVELESGHDAMITAPGALAGILLEDA